MNRKTIVHIIMLTVTLLSACSSQSSAETSTPTLAQTQSVPVTGVTPTETLPAATAAETAITSTATEDFTPTPAATRPPNAADCTNSASFVADITIPDNTEVPGGQTFTKTWRIMNTGTCVWAWDYTLSYYSEERMDAGAAVPLAVTYPGQVADISVELTAPNSIGVHRSNFVIKNPAGLIMKVNDDSRLWLIINVKTTVAATAAPTSQTTAATPTTASSGGSSSGLANATCGYSLDQTKILELLSAVNAYRAQSSMFAYPVNPKLAQAAQSHASDMACNQLTGHTGSNGSNVAQRVAATGYVAAYVDENAYGSSPPLSAQEVVNLWVNDTADTHSKLNLVSDTYIEIGIGYALFNNSAYYVIVLASP